MDKKLEDLKLNDELKCNIAEIYSKYNGKQLGEILGLQDIQSVIDKVKKTLQLTKEVYIIMSPGGGIGLDMSTGNGKCYIDLEKAKEALKSKNEWSKPRGRGIYELVILEVQNG